MKWLRSLLSMAAVVALVAGCGSQLRSPGHPSGAGRAVFSIRWPGRSRLIPTASNSIKIEIANGATVLASKVADRPADGSPVVVTFDNLPVGDLTATATAYPQAAGAGVAQAKAVSPVTVQDGQTAKVPLAMASTIDHLELASGLPGPGRTLQLTATAKNAGGEVVLMALAKLTWTSEDPAVMTVDPSGKVKGVAPGTTRVAVADGDSGKSASIPVRMDAPRILFMRQDNSTSSQQIYMMNPDGTGVIPFPLEPPPPGRSSGSQGSPVPSPDGTRIAFTSTRGGAGWEVWSAKVDGSAARQLTTEPGNYMMWSDSPTWSPDGAKIAFSTNRDGNEEIYVMNADGSNPTRLTDNPARDSNPDWSPDGSRLAFASDRDGPQGALYLMNTDGSGVISLGVPGGGPAWSPDGSRLAFGTGSGVSTIRPDGSGLTALLPGSGFHSPAWSPDGSKIAGVGGGWRICVMNADGSGQQFLTSGEAFFDAGPSWWGPGPQNCAVGSAVGTIN